MSTNETDGLRTVAEVASDLRCSRLTVYRAIERGELEAVRIGENGGLRIHDSSVSTFLVPAGDQRRVPARRGSAS